MLDPYLTVSRNTKPHKGSTLDRIASLPIKGYLYMEDATVATQRLVLAASRYPTSMKGMRFITAFGTIVFIDSVGNTKTVLRVERTA